jgi:L-asparaginase II
MENPVLVEVTRGPAVESAHRGAVAVVDGAGRAVLAIGDTRERVYPRSAVKLLQALPLVESGAADEFGFSEAELALACASHNGEPRHVETARAMLRKAGLSPEALECGDQEPALAVDRARLIRESEPPSALHNNCSGKHAGMLAFAQRLGVERAGYVAADHPVQRGVRAVLEEMTGEPLDAAPCGIDGCSIPTYAVKLEALARAFAGVASGDGLTRERAHAARRLMNACFAHPEMVAGEGRFCTVVMKALAPRVWVKTGAEGVFCAAFPEQGLGVALKIDDGATRASEVAMAAVIARLLDLSDEERSALLPYRPGILRNRRGIDVGEVRAAGPLA